MKSRKKKKKNIFKKYKTKTKALIFFKVFKKLT